MDSPICSHIVHADDRGSGTLHLTLECSRPGVATSHDVKPDHCAAALDDWLRARPDQYLPELLVTTSRNHHGWLGPVVDVLAEHRPTVGRLGMGAITFPDFARGSYVPEDRRRDGSSWELSVPLDSLVAALPDLEDVVVQATTSGWGTPPGARRPPPHCRR